MQEIRAGPWRAHLRKFPVVLCCGSKDQTWRVTTLTSASLGSSSAPGVAKYAPLPSLYRTLSCCLSANSLPGPIPEPSILFYFILFYFILFYFIILFYFLQRGRERDRELETWMREKHRPVASCTAPTGDVPATKVHALDRNQTWDLSVCRPMLYPLSQTGFG
uniref:Uncharacterized protein n=1 Tax=Pipistrellus kuhlii TaxID=59472 RepID=A0A7J7UTG2_PIPKU|nr:hypothetical protein mPipKuh1_008696 [Pipistrellus kuhlii]